ncbi:hypothetical protein B7O87_11585 [Cylindrospermopsis raciborskii CENA303]|uniref:Uncharacterized protein n=1 Tax=Cylindrospermopsis raciborskii CENA303 TaxID=1170769 RepID=A0A1X4G5G0_9CYAN|nr:hypothetical protein CRD_01111 [Raphidiopsis brookii D9]OSO89781.1 hypothetical protein B7O87_11585 [Cylindrospermopsis raciborskii CENA303]
MTFYALTRKFWIFDLTLNWYIPRELYSGLSIERGNRSLTPQLKSAVLSQIMVNFSRLSQGKIDSFSENRTELIDNGASLYHKKAKLGLNLT